MKGQQLSRRLLDAMAYIDDALIEEAAPSLENEQTDSADFAFKRRRRKGLMACAAVFAVTVVSLWVWKSGIMPQERIALEQEQNAGAYDTGGINAGKEDILLENAPAEEPAANELNDMAAAKEDNAVGAAVSDGVSAGAEAVEVEEENRKNGTIDDFAVESKGSIVRVIEEFPLPAVYCYAAPEKGSSIICAELKAAIDYYDYANNTIDLAEPEQYRYHVVIQVFGETQGNGIGETDDETANWNGLQFSEEGKEKLYQEYERMLSEGLDVSLSENYELTGMFDYEEIENFVPYSEYGYVFQLVNEN